jgi:hypothetical protein
MTGEVGEGDEGGNADHLEDHELGDRPAHRRDDHHRRGEHEDEKTTQDVRPAAFARTRRRFGYDLQAAHYIDAVRRLTGRTPAFAYIAIEPRPPYYVWVYELPPADLDRAEEELALTRSRYLAAAA